jgi:ribosome-binding factor A
VRSFKRADRVGALIQEILAVLVTQEVKDPRVKSAVITGIQLGDDLRLATVMYQTTSADPESVLAGLESARGFLRRELGERLRMKFVPDLRFRLDTSLTALQRIEEILKDLPRPSE